MLLLSLGFALFMSCSIAVPRLCTDLSLRAHCDLAGIWALMDLLLQTLKPEDKLSTAAQSVIASSRASSEAVLAVMLGSLDVCRSWGTPSMQNNPVLP